MSTRVPPYGDELLLALRVRDVPGPRIAEALAEVRSHVAETGEEPCEAFGPPRAYASQVAAALGRPAEPAPFRRGVLTWSTAASGLAGSSGAWLLLKGALGLAAGERGLFPVCVLVLGVVVLVALGVCLAWSASRARSPVVDPLTGADLTPPLPRWVLPTLVAPPVLALGLAVVLVVAVR